MRQRDTYIALSFFCVSWLFGTPSLVFHAVANVAGEPILDTNTEIASKNMGELVVKFIGDLPKTV